MIAASKPALSEVPAFYHGYIAQAVGDDIVPALTIAGERMRAVLGPLPSDLHEYRYAPGKWSVKEVVQHVIDGERVFAYRALRFARNDATELPGFEENDYVPASHADRRTLADLLAEHDAVRKATIALFNSFPAEAMARSGSANGQRVSVRGLGWIIAGHAMHHLRVLQERYLSPN